MNDLLNSPLIQDLKNGKLPEVEVEIGTQSILTLAGSILLVGMILIIAKSILNK